MYLARPDLPDRRRSIALISTIAACIAPGEEHLYAPVTVSAHIAAKLAGSRAGRLNPAAPREAARLLAAQS